MGWHWSLIFPSISACWDGQNIRKKGGWEKLQKLFARLSRGGQRGVTCGNAPPIYLQLLDFSSTLVVCIQLAHDQTHQKNINWTNFKQDSFKAVPNKLQNTIHSNDASVAGEVNDALTNFLQSQRILNYCWRRQSRPNVEQGQSVIVNCFIVLYLCIFVIHVYVLAY